MSETEELSLLEEYRANRDILYESLKVLDLYDNGEYKPQSILSSDWIEVDTAPGVFIKNITLHTPDSFVLSTIKGLKGAEGFNHAIFDDIELYCITGKIRVNGLVFKARDTWSIPAATDYSFKYLEDSYLTMKVVPRNNNNFSNFPIINTKEIIKL